ncbi:hypothetical protein PDUR_08370 [Paenibacillus durus]|uniref:Uncharacterized protein n=1 Tax=Paenibacillus durus TaxID=44251 RepID=A0A089ISF8_PAEDU|nr:hypothetical protein PDUR_08370 [Paenibacillus durus]
MYCTDFPVASSVSLQLPDLTGSYPKNEASPAVERKQDAPCHILATQYNSYYYHTGGCYVQKIQQRQLLEKEQQVNALEQKIAKKKKKNIIKK